MTKQVKYGLRVEFGEGSLKINNEVLDLADLPSHLNSYVGTASANLLIQTGKTADPLLAGI